MVARNITNTITDTSATRLKAHLDGPRNDAGQRKVIEYSDGTEITTERTAPGANRPDGRPALKEVRTIVRTKTPPVRVFGGFGPGSYDRKLIAKKEGE